jgi:hypothetical protein
MLFLFLAAAVVAVFPFCSIALWVTTPARERETRDRLALLKTLAEQPGENARQVLDVLREEEGRNAERRAREERRGWIVAGLIVMAVGAGVGVTLEILSTTGGRVWAVGLIPFLIGCVLLGAGLFGNRGTYRAR